jgi:hypothetical protein
MRTIPLTQEFAMTDMTSTIIPKSDQTNSDDLIGGPRTIKVTKVSLLAEDQPVAIHYEDDDGKPFKPCKSMRRVLVMVWGSDANAYAGRSMSLYRDENVKFGGQEVGGIRISHMSHLKEPVTFPLTATRGRKVPYKVLPLADAPTASKTSPEAAFKALLEKLTICQPEPGDASRWFNKVLGANGFESVGELMAASKKVQQDVYKGIASVEADWSK